MNNQPKYFITVFGGTYQSAHPIQGGCYPHQPGWLTKIGVVKGDILLLYCTGSYYGYDKEAPAIGVVTDCDIDKDIVYYRYLPLNKSITRQDMQGCLNQAEYNGFICPGNTPNWMREITSASFKKMLHGREINWP